MKNLIAFLLLASPVFINAQEPVKENKSNVKPAPSNEKSISEKGVSSTKGRGVVLKKAQPTSTVNPSAVETNEVAPVQETKPKTETKNP